VNQEPQLLQHLTSFLSRVLSPPVIVSPVQQAPFTYTGNYDTSTINVAIAVNNKKNGVKQNEKVL